MASSVWEKFCTSCICLPCGVQPNWALTFVALSSAVIGLTWMALGTWMTLAVLLNSNLPYDQQLFFEKVTMMNSMQQPYFTNESSFVFAPLDNLKFYLICISVIAFLGGFGRVVASICLLHYITRKTLGAVVSWAWVTLTLLAVLTLGILCADVMSTLSHEDVAPSHARDFYFKNDNWNFYTLCHIYIWFIWGDLLLACYYQWVVRWGYHKLGSETTVISTTP